MFNAIHALELGVKAALLTKVDNNLILHQVGGLFGREFRDTVGNEVCREINDILSKYNLPQYPGTEEITKEDAESTVDFVQKFIEKILSKIIKKRLSNKIFILASLITFYSLTSSQLPASITDIPFFARHMWMRKLERELVVNKIRVNLILSEVREFSNRGVKRGYNLIDFIYVEDVLYE